MAEEATHDSLAPVAVELPAVGPQHEKEPRPGRLTPRPSFLENLASSRATQFMLDRRNSSELDRYFVSHLVSRPTEKPPMD